MKNERINEAIKIGKRIKLADTMIHGLQLVKGDSEKSAISEYVSMSYWALSNQLWHDLTVDENDEPQCDGCFLVTMDASIYGGEGVFTTICEFVNGKWAEPDVYAWRTLPSPADLENPPTPEEV